MPRIMRSPASKSFRLENVRFQTRAASCGRWRIIAAFKRMAVSGQKLKVPGERSPSASPLKADIFAGPPCELNLRRVETTLTQLNRV